MQCPTNASARPSILLTNTSVPTTAWTSDTTYSGYTKRADITVTGATADMSGSVVFANAEASSGNYAPLCVTGTDKVSIYCRTAPSSAITIPTIKVDIAVSFTTLDNAPTSGSTLPVTSGGVYDAALKSYTVTMSVPSGVTGITVFNSNAIKIGRVVQFETLFATSSTISNVNLFALTSTAPVKKALTNVAFPTLSYVQGTPSSGALDRVLWLADGSDKYTTYINIPSDVSLTSGAWSISGTYLTDE